LTRGTLVPVLEENVRERFVVRKNSETTCLDNMAEVAYSFIDREEFAVIRAVLLLSRCKFTGEEG
jgi:hypothetical protein